MPRIVLSNNFIRSTCKLALNEDLYPSGDFTSDLIKNNIKKRAKLVANQNGVIAGFKMLVLIADIATKAPKRYEPPSPRKIFAFGKLYLRNIIKIKIPKNNKLAKSLFSFK